MAELQAKRLKLPEKSKKKRKKQREKFLKFHLEEAERNRQHELQLAKIYMRKLGTPGSSFIQHSPILNFKVC